MNLGLWTTVQKAAFHLLTQPHGKNNAWDREVNICDTVDTHYKNQLKKREALIMLKND